MKIWSFADDILLMSSHVNLNSAQHLLQNDFNKLNKWIHDIKLIINYEKQL